MIMMSVRMNQLAMLNIRSQAAPSASSTATIAAIAMVCHQLFLTLKVLA